MKFPHRNISINDIHLGREHTPTQHILDNLHDVLNMELLSRVDITYLTGDLFDYVLSNGHEDVTLIEMGMLAIAERHHLTGTALRLLRGTLSHDGTQPQNIANLISRVYPHLDFKYIDDMLIEYIPTFDIHVMYVPDEWSTREAIYLRARQLLEEHGLEKVDFIIGHNQFGFQYLPHVRAKISTLNEDDWCEMVRYHCYFGHIHRRSSYKNIEIAGSFDRLAHGEEHPKGLLEGIYRDEEDYEICFHENKNAAIYKTVRIPDDADISNPDFLSWCIEQTKHPDRPVVNIRYSYANKEFPVTSLINEMKKLFPYRFTTVREDSVKTDEDVVVLQDEDVYESIELSPSNILRVMEEELHEDEDKAEILALLKHYVDKLAPTDDTTS